jgi:hypothetical protein
MDLNVRRPKIEKCHRDRIRLKMLALRKGKARRESNRRVEMKGVWRLERATVRRA